MDTKTNITYCETSPTQMKLAKRIKEIRNDFEVIQGIKTDIAAESMTETMCNLQSYTELKKRYFSALNTLQLDCVGSLTLTQYRKLQQMIQHIKETL